jgi:hypothetical protein
MSSTTAQKKAVKEALADLAEAVADVDALGRSGLADDFVMVACSEAVQANTAPYQPFYETFPFPLGTPYPSYYSDAGLGNSWQAQRWRVRFWLGESSEDEYESYWRTADGLDVERSIPWRIEDLYLPYNPGLCANEYMRRGLALDTRAAAGNLTVYRRYTE